MNMKYNNYFVTCTNSQDVQDKKRHAYSHICFFLQSVESRLKCSDNKEWYTNTKFYICATFYLCKSPGCYRPYVTLQFNDAV